MRSQTAALWFLIPVSALLAAAPKPKPGGSTLPPGRQRTRVDLIERFRIGEG